jgi:primary-amine oxidase
MAEPKHPLDPLTSSEITQVSALLKEVSPGKALHFKVISIIEPPKQVLRDFLQAERHNQQHAWIHLPRQAAALYYHRGTSDLFLANVNLSENLVKDIKLMKAHFHGQPDIDEILELRDACLNHPKVMEEIRKYQLPDHLKVVCDTWPYGRDSSETNNPRYVQVRQIFYFITSKGDLGNVAIGYDQNKN